MGPVKTNAKYFQQLYSSLHIRLHWLLQWAVPAVKYSDKYMLSIMRYFYVFRAKKSIISHENKTSLCVKKWIVCILEYNEQL